MFARTEHGSSRTTTPLDFFTAIGIRAPRAWRQSRSGGRCPFCCRADAWDHNVRCLLSKDWLMRQALDLAASRRSDPAPYRHKPPEQLATNDDRALARDRAVCCVDCAVRALPRLPQERCTRYCAVRLPMNLCTHRYSLNDSHLAFIDGCNLCLATCGLWPATRPLTCLGAKRPGTAPTSRTGSAGRAPRTSP
jgi:hypothetical protein